MKNPWTIGAIIIGLVVIGGVVWWAQGTKEHPSTVLVPAPAQPGWLKFMGDTFSLSYPPEYSVDTNYEYQALGPGKEIEGVSFTIPESVTVGTNLATDTRISVEHADGACDASRFTSSASSATITDQGVSYSVATSSDAGAGNRYEETVFVRADTTPCLIVRYFIHYAAIENFDPGTVTAFDRNALLGEFDTIRRSLVLTK